ncbi:OsmC family peroxiredoxin [Candidatus Thorarchaeota archaeon]|jgi:uncharacterized OsmC-like protein|nr:MAG: OsmC family peroxiredoxin [Candidatus Thorarchaeota archaeon]
MTVHTYNISSRVTRPMFIGVKILNNDEFEVTSPPDWWPDAPEKHISPYTMLLGASASCFSLSVFNAAGSLHTSFSNIEVESVGTMIENEEGIWRFTSIQLKVKVTIDDESQKDKISRAIELAHKTCPVANSLKCPTLLDYEIIVD